MAIRFLCSGCSQPIEVDDEWALRPVACPYCRQTVTAPGESTLRDLSEIPTAAPLAPQAGDSAQPSAQPYSRKAPDAHPNQIAIVALVLALLVVAFLSFYLSVLRAHRLEMETFYRPDMTLNEQVQALSDYMDSQGQFPAWVMALSVLPLCAGLSWIGAIVCGIVAVRRPQRRRLAIAALLIAGFAPVLLCCGGGLILGPQTLNG